MILIIAGKEMDTTTDEIVCWIKRKNFKVKRVCLSEVLNTASFRIGQNNNPLVNKVKSIWLRNWSKRTISEKKYFGNLEASFTNKFKTIQRLLAEENKIKGIFFKDFPSDIWINRFENVHLNKYFVLEKAMELGLRIPDTLVTSSKIELEEFCENIPSGVITKPLYEVIFFEEKKRSINFRTQLLNTDSFDKLTELFFPSLFQKNIIKNYEIRSFFIKGEIFSMAIFSQQSSKTKIDFRNYDQDYPNRTIPFLLPTEVSSKLIGLFKYLKLDTGSADFIYGLDGCFYFLEINPSGQFGMVSKPCNYYLERVMANKLIDIGK